MTSNARLRQWVQEWAAWCQADQVHWCDGSLQEFNVLCDTLIRQGTFTRLDTSKRPGSFLARSDPGDVARVESRTFICSDNKDDAGPTKNWQPPDEMPAHLRRLYQGCIAGRTM